MTATSRMTEEDITELLNRCYHLVTTRGHRRPNSIGVSDYELDGLRISLLGNVSRWLRLSGSPTRGVHMVAVFDLELIEKNGRPDWESSIRVWRESSADDALSGGLLNTMNGAEDALNALRKHMVLDDLANT